jgi:maltodextrin utilization protein YvdJ
VNTVLKKSCSKRSMCETNDKYLVWQVIIVFIFNKLCVSAHCSRTKKYYSGPRYVLLTCDRLRTRLTTAAQSAEIENELV